MTNRNKWFIGLLAFLCCISCNEIDLDDIQNLNGNRIEIIGHGGGGFQSPNNPYPSNSKASILQAIENYNVDGVEVDVQISQDSTLWLYHDQSLSSQTDCQGCIIDMKSEDIASCKFQTDFEVNIFMNEQLMTLENLFAFAIKRNIPPTIFLDIKNPDFCFSTNIYDISFYEMYAQKLIDLIVEHDAASWVIIESSNHGLIRLIREKNPSVLVSLLTSFSDDDLQFAMTENIYGMTMNNNSATADMLKRAHDVGIRVGLFNTKVRSNHIDAVEKNPDYIITDNIILLQQILK